MRRKYLPIGITVTSHIFRHTFITRIYRATKDIQIAQELAGHANIATTTRYTHRTRDEKRAAVECLEADKRIISTGEGNSKGFLETPVSAG